MSDKADNRCALDFDIRDICVLERAKLPIEYRACLVYLHYEHVINIASAQIVLHPQEFPDGIRLRDWTDFLWGEC